MGAPAVMRRSRQRICRLRFEEHNIVGYSFFVRYADYVEELCIVETNKNAVAAHELGDTTEFGDHTIVWHEDRLSDQMTRRLRDGPPHRPQGRVIVSAPRQGMRSGEQMRE